MFTDSRSIDDRATAASFDTAYQKYASVGDAWFDGTPTSIDARLANCRRLMHIARTALGRRGASVGPLTNLAALEADHRALTALRHDLLTGAYDREDNSPIAGVHIAMPAPRGTDPHFTPHVEGPHGDIYLGDGDWQSDYGMEPDDEDRARWAELTRQRDQRLQEYIDKTGLDPYVPEWQAREEKARRDKQARNEGDDEDEEEFHDQHWADTWKDHNERSQPNDYLFDEMGRYHRDRFKGSSLSPQDRRYVTLESSKFLSDNTDTNDARELATRAMHHAQLVTSSFDVNRSRAVTAAFVARVAEGAYERQRIASAAPKPSVRTASVDNLPPEALFF